MPLALLISYLGNSMLYKMKLLTSAEPLTDVAVPVQKHYTGRKL